MEGKQWSGVTVQTMMASISDAVDAALREGALGGLDGHIGSGHFRARDMAFADAGAVHNPLVVGLDHFLQVLVGEKAGRGVAPQRADFRLGQ